MNYAGNYVSYYLNVEEAGDYNVILNVANGRAAFDFDPGMEVDGTKFPATINAKQTGDGEKNEWYNFENLEPVTVTLPKGHSILTLRASEKDKYPNIDYILVEKKQTATQSLKSAAAKKARTAEDTPASEPADSGKIMLVDVYNNPELMDDFLAQLSDDQLCGLMGGQTNTGVANTGGMGNLMEYGIPNAMTADVRRVSVSVQPVLHGRSPHFLQVPGM